jgi:hypothetical protein
MPVDQKLHHFHVRLDDRMHQSRSAVAVRGVHIGAGAKQLLNLHVVTIPDRHQQFC